MLAANPLTVGRNNHLEGDFLNTPTYTVVIYENEDSIGYWAKCPMDNGCCYTDGDTIKETQENMYESVSLYLEDDYPNVSDFALSFVMANE